ncbi:MAG: hypothetical protein AAFR84_01010 [Pseudomonadota bacterium]
MATQALLDALNAAIARGVLQVTYDGHTVRYQSLQDLMRARADVQRQISGGGPKVSYPVTNRGT